MTDKDYGSHYTRFEPWFGSWPPEFRGDGKMDEQNPDWIHRHFIHIVAGISTLIGIAFLFWASYLKDLWRDIIMGIGISFITAGIIEGTLEFAFVSRIAKEVFYIAFGYLLRPEISEGNYMDL